MTGYLWLCEKCDGNGTLIYMVNSTYMLSARMLGPFVPGYIYEYQTNLESPDIRRCPECKGRGYWEAA